MIKQIFNYWFRSKAKGDTGDFQIPLPRGSLVEFALGYAEGYYRTLPDSEAMRFYRQSSAVSTAVKMIANEVDQIKPVLKYDNGKYDSNPKEGSPEKAVLDFLKKPNPFQTYVPFIGEMARNYLLTNNALMYVGGTLNNPPKELYAVKPQVVDILEGENKFPQSYIVSEGPGVGSYQLTYEDDTAHFLNGTMRELYQTTGFSSNPDYLQGDSPLLPVCMEIYQQIRSKLWNISLIENGGKLSMVIKFDENLSEEQIRERLQRLKEQWSGADKSGIMGVQGSGTTFTEYGKTLKDMDFAVLDEVARQAIYLIYRIPLPLISNKASTFNNLKESIGLLYDWAVIPTYESIMTGLSNFILPRFGLDPLNISITYNPEEIPALKMRRLDEIEKRKKINIETPNELRELLPNREPLADGGDQLMVPVNLVPIATDVVTGTGNDDQDDESGKQKNKLKLLAKR